MAETYYELLGVPPDASTREIEAAYRERLKRTHPDVNDAPDASDRTKALIDAKEVLTDETERTRYDRLGHEAYVDDERPSRRHSNDATTADTDGQTGTTDTSRRQARTATDPTEKSATATGTTDDPSGRYGSHRDGARERRGDAWRWERDHAARSNTRREQNPRGTGGVTATAEPSLSRSLIPSGQSFVPLLATFVCYPVLLWGMLFPGFPLVINGLVGGCLLVLVAYMQSVPDVGVVVYGSWSVLLPVGGHSAGIPLTRPLVLVALVVTGLSFAFTLLTRAVVGS